MTTAIGVFGWSASFNVRPRKRDIPVVSRYFGPTTLICEAAGATIRRVLSFEEHRAGEAAGKQRDDARNGRRLDTWHRSHTLEHALLELAAALFRVTLRAEIE